MSLILDALNRSRTENDQVPGLGTRHDFPADTSPARYWILALALLIALLVIAWLLWDRGVSDEDVIPVARVTETAPSTASVKQHLPATAPPRTSPVAEAAVTVVAEPSPAKEETEAPADTGAPVSADISALYVQEPVAEAPPTSIATEAPAAEAKAEEKPVSDDAITESGVDIEQLVRQAETELENARLAEHSAPFISELSQRTKDTIPSIYYQQHDYSGRQNQSRVVLNGQELKAGGSPASGVKVKEILPDSVVLDYRGTEFRLRALNSWVNL